MFIESVKEYYGEISEEAEQFISDSIGRYSKKEQESLKNNLFKTFPIGKFPSMEQLSKFFDNHKPSTKIFFWSVCNDCGCEYDYKLPFCPRCEREGKHSSGYSVRKTDYEPNKKYIQLNKPWLTPYIIKGNKDTNGECVFCKKVNRPQDKFCWHFGDADYMCKYFETCECNVCCSFYARIQRKENLRMGA